MALLPGMGAGAQLFKPQSDYFKNLVIPDWLPPQSRESLPHYAERMAASLPPTTSIIGGCSFGGMVASEMTRYFPAKACILIASVSSPSELPKRIRMWRPMAPMVSTGLVMAKFASRSSRLFSKLMRTSTRSLLNQLSETDSQFLRWAAKATLQWEGATTSSVPFFKIHGERDYVLPCNLTNPDKIIAGGGHLLPMTHADDVNEFIESIASKTLESTCR